MISLNVVCVSRGPTDSELGSQFLPTSKYCDSTVLKTTNGSTKVFFYQFYPNIYQHKLIFVLLESHLLTYTRNAVWGTYWINHLEWTGLHFLSLFWSDQADEEEKIWATSIMPSPCALCVWTWWTELPFCAGGTSCTQFLISNRALESVGKKRSKKNGHKLKGGAGDYKVAMPPYPFLLQPQSNNVWFFYTTVLETES